MDIHGNHGDEQAMAEMRRIDNAHAEGGHQEPVNNVREVLANLRAFDQRIARDLGRANGRNQDQDQNRQVAQVNW